VPESRAASILPRTAARATDVAGRRFPQGLRGGLDLVRGLLPPHALLRGGVLVVGSTLAWHLSNFAFNSLSARLLGPATYGTLAAVVALLYVASPLFVAIQTVASRVATSLAARGELARLRGLVWSYGWRLSIGGVLLAGAVALASTGLANFLRLPSPTPVALLSVAFFLYVGTHLQRGVLQGTKSFGRYAISTLVEAGAKIVAVTVLLLGMWRSVDAAVFAVVLSAAVALVGNWCLLRYLPRSGGPPRAISHPYRYSAATLLTLILLAVLLSVDVLAAKRYLDGHEAGIYAAVSMAGKIVFFATSALTSFLFPVFSERQEIGIDPTRTLVKALAVIVAVSGALATVYLLAPNLVIGPLFGAQFHAGSEYLVWMAIAFGGYAVVYMLAMYLLSQKNLLGVGVLAVAVLVQLTSLYLLHGSISRIVSVDLSVFWATAFGLMLLCVRRHQHARSAIA
jgi:O-antigen/teichoic acid export membrane protein